MNKRLRPFLTYSLALALPLLLSACHKKVVMAPAAPASPPVAVVPPPARPDSVKAAPPAVLADVQNFEYQYLQFKGKVQYETSTDKQEAQVSIRMKRDSIIWASISKVGFEGVRAVITRDTVVLLDRLHKSYFAGNFKALKRRYHIPVTFDQLQAALVGNYLAGEGTKDVSERNDTPVQTLHHEQERMAVDQFINREKKRLVKLSVVDQRGNALTANYEDFKPMKEGSTEREFPYALLLNVLRSPTPSPAADVEPKTLLISLNHKAVTVPAGKLEFPLAIPADYERK